MSDINISLTQPEVISVTVQESEIQVTLSQPEPIEITLSQAQGVPGEAGTDGTPGDDGREIELQNTGVYIQWRYSGDVLWTNLAAIADLKGAKGDTGDTGATGSAGADGSDGYTPVKGVDYFDGSPGAPGDDGKEVELQNTGTYIQWRYVGESWTNLVALSALKGDQGIQGVKGDTGSTGAGVPSGGSLGQVLSKKSASDYDTEWTTPGSSGASESFAIAMAVAL